MKNYTIYVGPDSIEVRAIEGNHTHFAPCVMIFKYDIDHLGNAVEPKFLYRCDGLIISMAENYRNGIELKSVPEGVNENVVAAAKALVIQLLY